MYIYIYTIYIHTIYIHIYIWEYDCHRNHRERMQARWVLDNNSFPYSADLHISSFSVLSRPSRFGKRTRYSEFCCCRAARASASPRDRPNGRAMRCCADTEIIRTHQRSIKYHSNTSSTAQGGGGSFKNRKPIGEIGCCESRMSERIHWWTERCLRSPLFLSLSLTIYLPTYLSSMYLSIYLSLSLFHPITYLSIYPSIHPSVCLSISLSFICLSV